MRHALTLAARARSKERDPAGTRTYTDVLQRARTDCMPAPFNCLPPPWLPMPHMTRYLAWKFGRKLYCWARGDLANAPERNGEYWLLEKYLASAKHGAVLFDVGANVGEWTLAATNTAKRTGTDIPRVFAFEPAAATRKILEARLAPLDNVDIIPFALSSEAGEATFYSNAVASGTNSLNPESGTACEQVHVSTFDAFVGEHQIGDIGMVKIDTEGYDLNVLTGARRALAEGKIEVIQFEYNWRWLLNRASLRNVFDLIKGTPYALGKLERQSIAFFNDWHFELDRYFENNYVLIRTDSPILHIGKMKRFDKSNVEVPFAV